MARHRLLLQTYLGSMLRLVQPCWEPKITKKNSNSGPQRGFLRRAHDLMGSDHRHRRQRQSSSSVVRWTPERMEVEAHETPPTVVAKDDDAAATSSTSSSSSLSLRRWLQQLLINVAYMATALCVFSRGPTLIDLEEKYGVNTSTISIGFVTFSIGDIIGCPIAGFLLDHLRSYPFSIMFFNVAGMAISHAILPFLGDVNLFFVVSGLSGMFNGAIHTGFNSLSLQIWRGLNGRPFMHSLYLSYGAGGILASLVPKPFLSSKEGGGGGEKDKDSSIDILYLLVGGLTLAISLGFFLIGLQEIVRGLSQPSEQETSTKDPTTTTIPNPDLKISKPKSESKTVLHQDDDDSVEAGAKKSHVGLSWNLYIFISLIFFTIVTNIAFETAIPNYLPTFAVGLGHSKQDGVTLLAIFFTAYCTFRVVGIFLAIKISPGWIIIIDYSICVASTLVLSLFGEKSLLVLQVMFALLGIGSGSINATVWTWLEQHMPPTSVLVSVLVVAGGIGNLLVPLIVGNLIGHFTMVLVYYLLTFSVLGAAALGFSTLVGAKLPGISI